MDDVVCNVLQSTSDDMLEVIDTDVEIINKGSSSSSTDHEVVAGNHASQKPHLGAIDDVQQHIRSFLSVWKASTAASLSRKQVQVMNPCVKQRCRGLP